MKGLRKALSVVVAAGDDVPARTVLENDDVYVVADLLPETGWYDRGTGQFDSIDGRFLFHLDRARRKREGAKGILLLPQLGSRFVWIREILEGNGGARRSIRFNSFIENAAKVLYQEDLTRNNYETMVNNRMRFYRKPVPVTLENIRTITSRYSDEDLIDMSKASFRLTLARLTQRNSLELQSRSEISRNWKSSEYCLAVQQLFQRSQRKSRE